MILSVESTSSFSFKKSVPLLMILSLGAFWFNQRSPKTPFIDPLLAQQWVKEGGLLVDVRTPNEYNHHHLPDAINVPLSTLKAHISSSTSTQKHPLLSQKGKKIIVYCRSGNRSSKALRLLKKEGYQEVYNLGGLSRWP